MDILLAILVQLKAALIITVAGLVLERMRPIQTPGVSYHTAFNLIYLPFYLLIAEGLGRVYRLFPTLPQGLIPWPDDLLTEVAATLGLFVTYDFFYYFTHRLQHRYGVLWAGHVLHHSDQTLNVSTRNRTHWLEGPFTFLVAVTPTFLIWQPPSQWAFLAITGWSYFIHANANIPFGPFRHVVVGPLYHRIHHSADPQHHDKNFASFFVLWDILFGTHFDPERVDPRDVVTGVRGDPGHRPQELLLGVFQPLYETSRQLLRAARQSPAKAPAPVHRPPRCAAGRLRRRWVPSPVPGSRGRRAWPSASARRS